MKQSWSHKLFLEINARVGRYRLLDFLMILSARWLVFFMIFLVLLYGGYRMMFGDTHWIAEYLELFVPAFLFAELFSYLFAFVFRHPRPIVEFPHITQLVTPFETWKSFPSDHTILSFCVAGPLLLVEGTPSIVFTCIYSAAVVVACSRVYVGVHYPRDIAGGFIVAHAAVWLSPILLYHIFEPLYFLIVT